MTERDDIQELKDASKETLTRTVFWWAMIAVMAVFGYITTRITSLEDKVNDNRVMQAKIETQLAGIQSDLTELKSILKDHDN